MLPPIGCKTYATVIHWIRVSGDKCTRDAALNEQAEHDYQYQLQNMVVRCTLRGRHSVQWYSLRTFRKPRYTSRARMEAAMWRDA